MMMMLAQGDGRNVFEIVTTMFSRVDMLSHPQELLPQLEALSVVWSSIFLAGGIVCLIHGAKFYKVVTVLMALAIGGFVGYSLGKHVSAEVVVAGSLAALLAVACWPLMKYAVALMGGLVGAFLGANTWTAINATMHNVSDPTAASTQSWVGALLGLVLCGLLAFIVFQVSVVMFTCISGSTLLVMGFLSLMLQVPTWKSSISSHIENNAMVMPLLVAVPAIIGIIYQQAGPGAKAPEPAKAGK